MRNKDDLKKNQTNPKHINAKILPKSDSECVDVKSCNVKHPTLSFSRACCRFVWYCGVFIWVKNCMYWTLKLSVTGKIHNCFINKMCIRFAT